MELYEFSESGKSLLIKELKATKEVLENYRRDHLPSSEFDIYHFETDREQWFDKFQEEDNFSFDDLEKSENNNFLALYAVNIDESHYESALRDQIREEFVQGKYRDNHLIRTFQENSRGENIYFQNLLLCGKRESFYSNLEKKRYYRLTGLLSLPEELVALQLFEQGRYDLLAYDSLAAEIPFELYEETFKAKYPASIMEFDMMQDKKQLVESTERLLSYYRNKRK